MPADQDGAATPRQSAAARQLLGKALRRGARGLDVAQARLLGETAAPAPAQPATRRRPARPRGGPQARPGRRIPTDRRPADGGPAVGEARETFFRTLERTGDMGSAAAATTRALLGIGASARARTFAQVLRQQGGAVRQIGEICMAMTAVAGELKRTAAELFDGADRAEVVRLATAEYLRMQFGRDPESAASTLGAVLRGECPAEAGATEWLDIARTSFVAGYDDLSAAALDRCLSLADADADEARDPQLAQRLRLDATWLRSWHGRRAASPSAGDGPVLGVLSARSPERTATSRDVTDYVEPLAVLAGIARHATAGITGELAGVTQAFATERAPRHAGAPVQVVEIPRDAASWSGAPDGSWVLFTGELPRPLFGARADLPLPAGLRPIYLSVHVASTRTLTPEVLDHLRRHAPIGCRDWSTVWLLLAAGVPAFFAGGIAVSLDLPASGSDSTSREGTIALGDEDAESDEIRRNDFAANLRAAAELLGPIAGAQRVRTPNLQLALAARALGAKVDFTPGNPAQRRLYGLLDLGPAQVAAMQAGFSARLAAVLDPILSGAEPDAVYAAWQAACADDVATAEAKLRDVAPMPAPAIDVAAACATIHGSSVTIERSAAPADPDGAEINVELSLDGNYKHQLEVVLDSIVTNTSRPVRAFVLCRDHTPADYDRMTALFPEVSFVWLPTDAVDYGPISGLLGYTTVATMDRLLLPELLPDVSRIVHHDLDALCLADLGELHDVALDGRPLAGRMSPQQSHVSGFASLMRRSEQFPRDPARGHEFLQRTHARHRFDYDILNAGIMTLDLDTMRADDFCRSFLPYVERFGLNDQAVLNVYAGGNRVEVHPGWNWRPWLETLDEPKIAHWAGEFKPWKDTWVVGRDLWQAAEARVAARYARAGIALAHP